MTHFDNSVRKAGILFVQGMATVAHAAGMDPQFYDIHHRSTVASFGLGLVDQAHSVLHEALGLPQDDRAKLSIKSFVQTRNYMQDSQNLCSYITGALSDPHLGSDDADQMALTRANVVRAYNLFSTVF